MIRVLFIQILVFLFPFALYALYVKFQVARGKEPSEPWGRNILFWLVLCGLLLMGGGFIVLSSFTGEKPGGIYRPAEMIDGKIRPGQFERSGAVKAK